MQFRLIFVNSCIRGAVPGPRRLWVVSSCEGNIKDPNSSLISGASLLKLVLIGNSVCH